MKQWTTWTLSEIAVAQPVSLQYNNEYKIYTQSTNRKPSYQLHSHTNEVTPQKVNSTY